MARYEVLWDEPVHRVENRDDYCVGLVVKRDGEGLGMWLPMVTGISLRTDASEPDERFWSALAILGADRVKEQMYHEAVTAWRREAWSVPVEAAAVRACLVADVALPTGPSDVPILAFIID